MFLNKLEGEEEGEVSSCTFFDRIVEVCPSCFNSGFVMKIQIHNGSNLQNNAIFLATTADSYAIKRKSLDLLLYSILNIF